MQLPVCTRTRARKKLWKEKEKDESKRKKGGKRLKEERETNEDSEEERKKRQIQKVQTSKKMKSIQELTTDLGSTRQRKAVKLGEKNDKGGKKKVFSSQ